MRVINFNAGPAGLPLPALERARDELIDFQGSGMSIMEHSHRGKDYEKVHGEAIALRIPPQPAAKRLPAQTEPPFEHVPRVHR